MINLDFPNLPPSICFLCEGAPQETVFVDTFRNFDPGFITYLNGRKYVCANCVTDLAHQIGAFDSEREKFQTEIVAQRVEIADLLKKVRDYQALDEAIRTIASTPKSTPKPKKTQPQGGQ